MKVALNEAHAALYKLNKKNVYHIIDDIAQKDYPADYYGYGMHSKDIIEENGVLYATWDTYSSCD